MKREYAVPRPYWVENEADLDGLRQQLAAAETAATQATSWTARTRAAEDVKQLRQKIAATELHQHAGRASSLSFAEQHEVVQAAMAELRRVGAV